MFTLKGLQFTENRIRIESAGIECRAFDEARRIEAVEVSEKGLQPIGPAKEETIKSRGIRHTN